MNDVLNTTNKPELVVMERVEKQIFLYYRCIHRKLNNLSLQLWKLSKHMTAECLIFLCFINHLPAHFYATNKSFMQHSLRIFID